MIRRPLFCNQPPKCTTATYASLSERARERAGERARESQGARESQRELDQTEPWRVTESFFGSVYGALYAYFATGVLKLSGKEAYGVFTDGFFTGGASHGNLQKDF